MRIEDIDCLSEDILKLNPSLTGKSGAVVKASVRYQSEESFQREVIKLLKEHGWKVHGERPARTNKGWVTPIVGDAGYPDLTATKGDTVLFLELKSESGTASKEQVNWLMALGKVNQSKTMILSPSNVEDLISKL
jgi:Holliday junction resolvase